MIPIGPDLLIRADGDSMAGMSDAIIRYTALTIGLFATSLVMVLAAGSLVSDRGLPGPTVTASLTPVQGTIAVGLCLLVSLAVAIVVGRVVNAAVGAFVLGAGIAVLSMRCGTHLDQLFSGGPSGLIVLETLIWGLVVLVMIAVLFRFTGPLPEQPGKRAEDAFRPSAVFSGPALKSCIAGIGMLFAIWILGVNDLKGQMIAACLIGGVLAGVGGRLLAPWEQPILIFAAPVIFGAMGQAYALGTNDDPTGAWLSGTQSPLGMPMPMDIAAGSLMGVAIGLAWARGRAVENGSGDPASRRASEPVSRP